MSISPAPPTLVAKPYPSLLRSRNLLIVWMLRLLVRMGAFASLVDSRDPGYRDEVFQRLGLPRPLADAADSRYDDTFRRLVATLETMEQRIGRFRLDGVMEANLSLLDRQFALSSAERIILALAVYLRADETLHTVATFAKRQVNVVDQLAITTRLRPSSVHKALSPMGNLRRSGLLQVGGGNSPAGNLTLRRGGMRVLATTRLKCVDELFGTFLRPCPAGRLSPADYIHLGSGFELASALVREASASRRKGVNILLHGPPGVGKSELTRTIAHQLGIPLYEVSSIDEDGQPLQPRERLAGAAIAQRLLSGRRAVLVFDEIDVIFNDGSRFSGKPTTAEQAKAWVNTLLEEAPVPTLWVANRIGNMDPAFLRRFDLVLELDSPPLHQRMKLLEQTCGGFVDGNNIRRLAQSDAITPAVLTRASNVARRVRIAGQSPGALIETVLDGTLKAQGHQTVREASRGLPPANYDPALCNASENLSRLAAGLARAGTGRICLYGPPGTGKTAFGYWLSQRLGSPLLLKRMSDLQSPFLGVMERNLARAFEKASCDDAILQIDEVDSFLRKRESARQSWEVSQVNEFLTQLECFDGIFVASTNLMGELDPAALRRFDHKIHIDYMRPDQIKAMLDGCLRDWGLDAGGGQPQVPHLQDLDRITPGDFAVISRRHQLMPFESADSIVEALRDEQALKGGGVRKMGFV